MKLPIKGYDHSGREEGTLSYLLTGSFIPWKMLVGHFLWKQEYWSTQISSGLEREKNQNNT